MSDTRPEPGSRWTDGDHLYVLDDRPCGYVGLVPALLHGEAVLLRESDFDRRLRRVPEHVTPEEDHKP